MQLLLQISIRSNVTPVPPQLRCPLLYRPSVHSYTFDFRGRTHYSALERFVGASSVGFQALSFG